MVFGLFLQGLCSQLVTLSRLYLKGPSSCYVLICLDDSWLTPVTPNYVGLPWCVPCVPAMSHGPLWPLWAARFLGQKRHFKTPRRPHKALINLSRQQFAFIWNHCESLWIISIGNMTINNWNFGAIFSQTRMIASISEIARKRPCFELVNRQSRYRSRSRGKNKITNIKHPHSMVAEMWFRPLHLRWFLKGCLYEQRTKSFVVFYAMHKLGSSPIACKDFCVLRLWGDSCKTM